MKRYCIELTDKSVKELEKKVADSGIDFYTGIRNPTSAMLRFYVEKILKKE